MYVYIYIYKYIHIYVYIYICMYIYIVTLDQLLQSGAVCKCYLPLLQAKVNLWPANACPVRGFPLQIRQTQREDGFLLSFSLFKGS